jgi:hypothetical protein
MPGTESVISRSRPPRRIARSVLALLAGIFTGVILSLGTDLVMRATGVFPPLGQPLGNWLLLWVLAYRTVYGVAGSYVAARAAPNRPMGHALTLGTLGLLVSTAGVVATWNGGPAYDPKWYPIALVVTTLPCAWAGGRLYLGRLTTS